MVNKIAQLGQGNQRTVVTPGPRGALLRALANGGASALRHEPSKFHGFTGGHVTIMLDEERIPMEIGKPKCRGRMICTKLPTRCSATTTPPQVRLRVLLFEYDCRSIVPTQIKTKTQEVLKTTSPSAPTPRSPNGKSNRLVCENREQNAPAIVTPLPAKVALTRFG